MKLAKVLLASFVLQFLIVGAGRFISQWVFGPTSPRENTLALLWGVTGLISSAITMAVLDTMMERPKPGKNTVAVDDFVRHHHNPIVAAKDAEIARLHKEVGVLTEDWTSTRRRLDAALDELRCPDCRCADQIDAESSECGCDSPVCSRTVPMVACFLEQVKEIASLRACLEAAEHACDGLRNEVAALLSWGPLPEGKNREVAWSRVLAARNTTDIALAALAASKERGA